MNEEIDNEVILTEENKVEVAFLLGYTMETVDNLLAQAKEKGFKGVRLSNLKH